MHLELVQAPCLLHWPTQKRESSKHREIWAVSHGDGCMCVKFKLETWQSFLLLPQQPELGMFARRHRWAAVKRGQGEFISPPSLCLPSLFLCLLRKMVGVGVIASEGTVCEEEGFAGVSANVHSFLEIDRRFKKQRSADCFVYPRTFSMETIFWTCTVSAEHSDLFLSLFYLSKLTTRRERDFAPWNFKCTFTSGCGESLCI